MEKTTTALETPLREQLDRLAAFEATDFPVLSLYLDMRSDRDGKRSDAGAFLAKIFPDRIRTLQGDARASVERDAERIREYLVSEVRSSTSGLAIFACAAQNEYFEAVQLDAPIDEHGLFIGSVPHLYPLARLNDQYPRYAALLMDTNSARLFVFRLGTAETEQRISGVKTRRGSMGGWSQARYQRHMENFHLHHVKEVVSMLDQVVREEHINHIVVACEETARALLMEQLPKHLADKIIDLKVNLKDREHEVMTATLEALRLKDATTDAEHVERMLDAWAANGLGVVGPDDTLDALIKGQVEELLITATPDELREASTVSDKVVLADELVTRAQQTAARIRFIENPDLMKEVGGVGALLRFKI